MLSSRLPRVVQYRNLHNLLGCLALGRGNLHDSLFLEESTRIVDGRASRAAEAGVSCAVDALGAAELEELVSVKVRMLRFVFISRCHVFIAP